MKQREIIPLMSQWLWVSSPALIQLARSKQGFHFSPFECTHLLLVPQCVCPSRFLMSLFFSSQSVSSFPCLALSRSSPCSSSEQTSHPKSIQPSPISSSQKNSSLGACVLNNSYEKRIVVLLLLLRCFCTYLFWGKPAQNYGSFTAQQSPGWSWGLGYLLLLLK